MIRFFDLHRLEHQRYTVVFGSMPQGRRQTIFLTKLNPIIGYTNKIPRFHLLAENEVFPALGRLFQIAVLLLVGIVNELHMGE